MGLAVPSPAISPTPSVAAVAPTADAPTLTACAVKLVTALNMLVAEPTSAPVAAPTIPAGSLSFGPGAGGGAAEAGAGGGASGSGTWAKQWRPSVWPIGA